MPEKISRTKVILSSVYFIYIYARTHARNAHARTRKLHTTNTRT